MAHVPCGHRRSDTSSVSASARTSSFRDGRRWSGPGSRETPHRRSVLLPSALRHPTAQPQPYRMQVSPSARGPTECERLPSSAARRASPSCHQRGTARGQPARTSGICVPSQPPKIARFTASTRIRTNFGWFDSRRLHHLTCHLKDLLTLMTQLAARPAALGALLTMNDGSTSHRLQSTERFRPAGRGFRRTGPGR